MLISDSESHSPEIRQESARHLNETTLIANVQSFTSVVSRRDRFIVELGSVMEFS